MDIKEIIYQMCSTKEENKYTWNDISNLIKEKYNISLSADFIRHEWYGIRNYKKIINSDIGTRILSLSDLHIPYHIPLENIKNKYKNKIDILVFNGDEQDCQSISSFPKAYRKPFMEELILTRQIIIDIVTEINPQKLVFVVGNHNKRMITYFSKNLDTDVLELLPDNNLELIINTGFTRYNHETHTKEYYEPLRKVFNKTDIVFDGNYYAQIGKTLFVHPQAFSSSIMKTVEKTAIHFSRERLDFDTIVLGHTHRLGFYRWGNINLYEQGCLCKQMDYSKGRLIQQQANGCVYIVQDKEGNLIYDKSVLEVI